VKKTQAQLKQERNQHMEQKVQRTRDIIALLAKSLRKRGVKVNLPPLTSITKKQLSGYFSYIQELDRKNPLKELK